MQTIWIQISILLHMWLINFFVSIAPCFHHKHFKKQLSFHELILNCSSCTKTYRIPKSGSRSYEITVSICLQVAPFSSKNQNQNKTYLLAPNILCTWLKTDYSEFVILLFIYLQITFCTGKYACDPHEGIFNTNNKFLSDKYMFLF